MRRKLDEVDVNLTLSGASTEVLGIYSLDVSSSQPEQPVGSVQGLNGAAGKNGRIGNSVRAVQKMLRNESLLQSKTRDVSHIWRAGSITRYGDQTAQ
jgi:hypothetical protein